MEFDKYIIDSISYTDAKINNPFKSFGMSLNYNRCFKFKYHA